MWVAGDGPEECIVCRCLQIGWGDNEQVVPTDSSGSVPKTGPGGAVRGPSVASLESHWQRIEFRSSPGVPVGSGSGFGVMVSEREGRPAPYGAGFCCFNNGIGDKRPF